MAARPRSIIDLTGFPLRLNELIGDEAYVSFEEKCSLKHGNIKGFLRGVEPSREKLAAIIKNTGCNARWLVTGEGEPFGDEKSPPASAEGLDMDRLTKAQATFARDVAFLQSVLSGLLTSALDSPLFAQQYAENVRALRPTLEKLAASAANPPAS